MTSSSLARRDFVCAGAAAACAVVCGGCGEAPAEPRELPGIAITDDAVVIPLIAVPALDRAGGHLVIRTVSVIVLNLGPDGFRAFSNVCTHAGCGVDRFERNRIICPCHGSEYDTDGLNVAGPAPEPLRRLALHYDVERRTVRVTRR